MAWLGLQAGARPCDPSCLKHGVLQQCPISLAGMPSFPLGGTPMRSCMRGLFAEGSGAREADTFILIADCGLQLAAATWHQPSSRASLLAWRSQELQGGDGWCGGWRWGC